MALRQGKVFVHNIYAGVIAQLEDHYVFKYDESYLQSTNPKPVSLTLPLRNKEFLSKTILPFFDGLIPEGWLLDIASKNWKLNSRDRMGLLLTVCQDCIGAVHVIDDSATNNNSDSADTQ